MGEVSADPTPPNYVDHPLWTHFLRWCTIRPKTYSVAPEDDLVGPPQETNSRSQKIEPYQYVALPDPLSFIRLATLLPGDFTDEIVITLDNHVLRPSSRPRPARLTLAEIRRDLPPGWEAFQTIVDGRYFFRNVATGKVQWEHPDPGFHIEQYQIPQRNAGVIPVYETVSYVWGSKAKDASIRVDTPDGPYELRVTQSLYTVLRHLRQTDTSRVLWVDAICLNQSDYTELRHQVPRMRDIYSLASRATLWLGTSTTESSHAIERLRYLGEQIASEADTGLLFPSPDATENDWFDPDVPLPFSQHTWDAITALLQRPWFYRLWVVQEIQPGAVVQCGFDKSPVGAITEAIYCLYSKKPLPEGLRPHLEQGVGTLARLPALAFTRLLYRVSTFKGCSDPRDKLYGLLGLAPKKLAAAITVSYEEETTATDVYRMTFMKHLEITQRLEHFHNCFLERTVTKGAPSWVPDWWSDIPGDTYIPALFAASTSRAHYTYESSMSGSDLERPSVLRVRGVRCGTVNFTTTPLNRGIDKQEAIRRVRAWQPDDLDNSTYGPTGESTRQAYAVTLICGILKEREPDWILTSTADWVRQDWENALFGERAAVIAGSEPDSTEIRSDVADALQCCTERLFFRTEEGYMGLAPKETRAGDEIAVLLGCSTPLVLRPSEEGPEDFIVVGECFVYGLHDAIGLLGPLPQPWRGIATWKDGDRRVLRFLNTTTHEVTDEDPRLGALTGWKRVTDKLVDGDDPIMYDFFRHSETGELINYDPRLEPEELEGRGVNLTWFSLV